MDKYYNPSLEEFHIGFEYEIKYKSDNEWKPQVLSKLYDVGFVEFKLNRKKEDVRVKYLNREDIIFIGFLPSKVDNYNIKESFFETKDGSKWLNLEYFEENKGWFVSIDEEESQFGFAGWIKNKSELKVVLKQLNII